MVKETTGVDEDRLSRTHPDVRGSDGFGEVVYRHVKGFDWLVNIIAYFDGILVSCEETVALLGHSS